MDISKLSKKAKNKLFLELKEERLVEDRRLRAIENEEREKKEEKMKTKIVCSVMLVLASMGLSRLLSSLQTEANTTLALEQ